MQTKRPVYYTVYNTAYKGPFRVYNTSTYNQSKSRSLFGPKISFFCWKGEELSRSITNWQSGVSSIFE